MTFFLWQPFFAELFLHYRRARRSIFQVSVSGKKTAAVGGRRARLAIWKPLSPAGGEPDTI